jgi:Ser/Thr protein kinase RdoA (MazF antagonist)
MKKTSTTTTLLSTTGRKVNWLTPSQVDQALQLYGVTSGRLTATYHGYRNQVYVVQRQDGAALTLRLHKQEPDVLARLARTQRLCDTLHHLGQPVPAAVDTRILQLKNGRARRYASLLTYLPGETIPWEAYSMKHLKLLGWAMAALHRDVRRVETTGFPRLVSEYSAILRRMQRYFERQTTVRAVAKKLGVSLPPSALETLRHFVAACQDLPDQQLLHMDLVRGNVLFSQSSETDGLTEERLALTGILDFEKAGLGHPLFDIARTLAFLLVDCSTKTDAQVRKYFVQSGYRKRGQSQVKPLSVTLPHGVKCDVLETAIDLFLLYDFYKFLRDNPYESLAQNYHYMRTRDILLQKNLLHYRES